MNKEKSVDDDMPTRKIFIDHVICNDTKFTDSEIRDHVYTVVAAGSETTSLQTSHTSKCINWVLITCCISDHFQ